MGFSAPTTAALQFALEIRDADADGEDYGDSMRVDVHWQTGRTKVELFLWSDAEERDVKQRVLDIRRAIGGTFEKNDPTVSNYDDQYARLVQHREDFDVEIVTSRANTCVRKQVSVEMIEHPATAAYTEEKPVYEWDCTPLNEIARDVEPASA